MELSMIYEIIGYIASILVAISLLMTSILRLRLINIVGAIVFVIYGLLIGAYPVALVNFIIVLINLYQLYRLYNLKDQFSLLNVAADDPYLQRFLSYHHDDIQQVYPTFARADVTDEQADMIVFILRNMLPVGLFIAQYRQQGQALIQLDFVIRDYRDFKVGRYLYHDNANFFHQRQIKQLISYPGNALHQTYLERMGFKRDLTTSDRALYQLSIDDLA